MFLPSLVLHLNFKLFVHLLILFDLILSRLYLMLNLSYLIRSKSTSIWCIVSFEHLNLLQHIVRQKYDFSRRFWRISNFLQYWNRLIILFKPFLCFFKNLLISSYLSFSKKLISVVNSGVWQHLWGSLVYVFSWWIAICQRCVGEIPVSHYL